MALNRVKELLSAGKPAFACIATIASAVVQVRPVSFDLILIDLEHGLIDLATARR
jgi:2-keto-3-deoxy-L-rhamnonate aldolase RhmA